MDPSKPTREPTWMHTTPVPVLSTRRTVACVSCARNRWKAKPWLRLDGACCGLEMPIGEMDGPTTTTTTTYIYIYMREPGLGHRAV